MHLSMDNKNNLIHGFWIWYEYERRSCGQDGGKYNAKAIEFFVNDETQEIAFENVKFDDNTYFLAVSLSADWYGMDCSVNLVLSLITPWVYQNCIVCIVMKV